MADFDYNPSDYERNEQRLRPRASNALRPSGGALSANA